MHLLHRSSNLTVLCLFRIPPLQTKHCMRTVLWMLNNPWWGKALTDQHGQKPSIKRDSRGHSVNSTKTGERVGPFWSRIQANSWGQKNFEWTFRCQHPSARDVPVECCNICPLCVCSSKWRHDHVLFISILQTERTATFRWFFPTPVGE